MALEDVERCSFGALFEIETSTPCCLSITSRERFDNAVADEKGLGHFDIPVQGNVGDFAQVDERVVSWLQVISSKFPRCSFEVVVDTSLPLDFPEILRIPVSINIYGLVRDGKAVGNTLSDMLLFLQHPQWLAPGHSYDNPQYLGKVKQEDMGPNPFIFGRQVMFLVIENFAGREAGRLRQLVQTSFESEGPSGELKSRHRGALNLATALTKGRIDLTAFEMCVGV
ncbi:hypothetical protein QBC37DRAFT_463197 [Rhypophila decipiens]|uniref:Uncharacterized protein n=1 Tax=Rhypophila decipiens TaxID=261697 RepID=A0AAN6XS65_9PEZI|nr:hypothetical protein QBC37DRAFT_463197 [Rhypophila decipiens]